MTEGIKLQKYVADCGLMSRRAAEKEIEAGNFEVNGKPATLGMRIDPNNDAVTYKGKSVSPTSGRKVYIILNKPKGVVTTMSDEKGRKSVKDVVDVVKIIELTVESRGGKGNLPFEALHILKR
jgi:23S rRNA pseudouridine2605 synthase